MADGCQYPADVEGAGFGPAPLCASLAVWRVRSAGVVLDLCAAHFDRWGGIMARRNPTRFAAIQKESLIDDEP